MSIDWSPNTHAGAPVMTSPGPHFRCPVRESLNLFFFFNYFFFPCEGKNENSLPYLIMIFHWKKFDFLLFSLLITRFWYFSFPPLPLLVVGTTVHLATGLAWVPQDVYFVIDVIKFKRLPAHFVDELGGNGEKISQGIKPTKKIFFFQFWPRKPKNRGRVLHWNIFKLLVLYLIFDEWMNRHVARRSTIGRSPRHVTFVAANRWTDFEIFLGIWRQKQMNEKKGKNVNGINFRYCEWRTRWTVSSFI